MRQGDKHIIDARHLAIDARLLKRSEQSKSSNFLDRQFRDLLTLEPYAPGVDGVIADYGVEQRGLT